MEKNEMEVKERIEELLAAWPRESSDFWHPRWDRYRPLFQSRVIRWFIEVTLDSGSCRTSRRNAYDVLMDRARALSEGVPFGDLIPERRMPLELMEWCVRVATGEIERPPRPPGPDPRDNAARDWKLEEAVTEVTQRYGYSQAQAIRCVAEVAHLSVDSVKRAIRLVRQIKLPS